MENDIPDFLALEDTDAEIIPPDQEVDLQKVPTVTTNVRMAAREVAAQMGEYADPLRFMLGIVLDEDKPLNARLDAAKASASYLYPKLAAVAVADGGGKSIEDFLGSLPNPD